MGLRRHLQSGLHASKTATTHTMLALVENISFELDSAPTELTILVHGTQGKAEVLVGKAEVKLNMALWENDFGWLTVDSVRWQAILENVKLDRKEQRRRGYELLTQGVGRYNDDLEAHSNFGALAAAAVAAAHGGSSTTPSSSAAGAAGRKSRGKATKM